MEFVIVAKIVLKWIGKMISFAFLTQTVSLNLKVNSHHTYFKYVSTSQKVIFGTFVGDVTCINGTIEIEPFYHQGICHVKDTDYNSVPCQNWKGEYTCSKILHDDLFCRGFSVSLETENCEE